MGQTYLAFIFVYLIESFRSTVIYRLIRIGLSESVNKSFMAQMKVRQ